MPVGRKYSMHRQVIAKLKYKQLDVYRYKNRDVLRLRLPNGRVILAELDRHREDYTSPEEFEKAVTEAVKRVLEKEKEEKKST